ncbi:MAG: hypothetical protein QMD78_02110 [Methanocellales archaeon]|nr:hypothetical protein [Methanocellales archaeon]
MKSDDSTLGHIWDELRHHVPFTAFSACVALILLGILTMAFSLSKAQMSECCHELFHVFHPVHIFFSATATTAMFWRHERRLLRAVIIGLIGSLGICGISDIFLPFLGGTIVGVGMKLHWCLIEHPMTIVPFAIFGVLLGLVSTDVVHGRGSTIFSHSSHVFMSTMATTLYLMAFGFTEWIPHVAEIFLLIFLGVMIPCCTSDIIFPLLLSKSINIMNECDKM